MPWSQSFSCLRKQSLISHYLLELFININSTRGVKWSKQNSLPRVPKGNITVSHKWQGQRATSCTRGLYKLCWTEMVFLRVNQPSSQGTSGFTKGGWQRFPMNSLVHIHFLAPLLYLMSGPWAKIPKQGRGNISLNLSLCLQIEANNF